MSDNGSLLNLAYARAYGGATSEQRSAALRCMLPSGNSGFGVQVLLDLNFLFDITHPTIISLLYLQPLVGPWSLLSGCGDSNEP